eukprot:2416789-Rhodomonas_salina.4
MLSFILAVVTSAVTAIPLFAVQDLVMAGLAACTSMTLQTRASMMLKTGKLKEGDLTRVHQPNPFDAVLLDDATDPATSPASCLLALQFSRVTVETKDDTAPGTHMPNNIEVPPHPNPNAICPSLKQILPRIGVHRAGRAANRCPAQAASLLSSED